MLYAAAGLAPLPATGEPMDTRLQLGIGWDDNPAQRADGPALAFARYALGLTGGFDDRTGWGLDGYYRDYEGDNDSYRIDLSADRSGTLEQGLGQWDLSLEAGLYRDRLVPADERDEAALGARYDRVLSPRADLGASAEVRWLGYRNASLPWSGRPGASAGNASPQRAGPGGYGQPGGQEARSENRDDLLAGLGLDGTWHWSPDLAGTLALNYTHRASSVAMEGYDQWGGALLVTAQPASDWRLELEAGWYRYDYDHAAHQPARQDERLFLALSLRRGLGNGELFCDLSHLDNSSNLASGAFQQTVTHCGLAWHL